MFQVSLDEIKGDQDTPSGADYTVIISESFGAELPAIIADFRYGGGHKQLLAQKQAGTLDKFLSDLGCAPAELST